jgi:predicted DsbA family dithiol-disulfide isomerase
MQDETNANSMICDIETGVCGPSGSDSGLQAFKLPDPKPVVDIYYFTDPICSHCWALEPVLRRFEKQYGRHFRLRTVMGGLLEKWDGFADVKNGISSPADVAAHWREVGEQSRMPIDGTLWHDNPVQSSFIPSRVFKVIQEQDEGLALKFLRRAREAVFAFNRNIADEDVLIELVDDLGLNGREIVAKANGGHGQQLLDEDFELRRSLGARGFPTIIMVNADGEGVRIVGARSLQEYAEGLQQVLGKTDGLTAAPQPRLSALLGESGLLFARELEEMYELEPDKVTGFIQANLPDGSYELGEVLGETYLIDLQGAA